MNKQKQKQKIKSNISEAVHIHTPEDENYVWNKRQIRRLHIGKTLQSDYSSDGCVRKHVIKQKLYHISKSKTTCPETFLLISHNYIIKQQ